MKKVLQGAFALALVSSIFFPVGSQALAAADDDPDPMVTYCDTECGKH